MPYKVGGCERDVVSLFEGWGSEFCGGEREVEGGAGE